MLPARLFTVHMVIPEPLRHQGSRIAADWGPVSSTVRDRFLAGSQTQQRLTPAEASWWVR